MRQSSHGSFVVSSTEKADVLSLCPVRIFYSGVREERELAPVTGTKRELQSIKTPLVSFMEGSFLLADDASLDMAYQSSLTDPVGSK